MSAYDELQVKAADYRELDAERILVLHGLTGRGKMSGIDLGRGTRQGAVLFHVRSGKVIRLVVYPNREMRTPASGSGRRRAEEVSARV